MIIHIENGDAEGRQTNPRNYFSVPERIGPEIQKVLKELRNYTTGKLNCNRFLCNKVFFASLTECIG